MLAFRAPRDLGIGGVGGAFATALYHWARAGPLDERVPVHSFAGCSEAASTAPELVAQLLELLPAGTGWLCLAAAVAGLFFLLGVVVGALAGCLGTVLLQWRRTSGPGTSAALARLAGYRSAR